MSKLKHTPGPWVLCSPEEYPWLLGDVIPEYRERTLTILGSDGYGVLSVPISITDNYPESQTAMANARLLAAAPDMLDALVEAYKFYREAIVDYGPCDHSVNICICHLIRQTENIQEIIESATGLPIEEVLK